MSGFNLDIRTQNVSWGLKISCYSKGHTRLPVWPLLMTFLYLVYRFGNIWLEAGYSLTWCHLRSNNYFSHQFSNCQNEVRIDQVIFSRGLYFNYVSGVGKLRWEGSIPCITRQFELCSRLERPYMTWAVWSHGRRLASEPKALIQVLRLPTFWQIALTSFVSLTHQAEEIGTS